MNYRYATIGELDRMESLHPELAATEPELAKPVFPKNPVLSKKTFPFIFYVLDGKNIVGSRRAIPDKAVINGEEFDWAWCFDTYVSKSHHGKGIGSKLVSMQVEKFKQLNTISGAAFSAPAMMRIYEKLGYTILKNSPRMTLVRNAKPFLAKKIPFEPALSIAGKAGSMVFAVEQFFRNTTKAHSRFQLKPIGRKPFEQVFDALQETSIVNHWDRSASWVLARLRKGDEIVSVLDNQTNTSQALLVLRERTSQQNEGAEARRLSVVYFLATRSNRLVAQAIAASLAQLLEEKKLDVADIITSCPIIIDECKRKSYRPRGVGMTFAFKAPPHINIHSYTNIEQWHLTHFCSDGFRFC